jgi:hypothetical protein
MLFGDTPRHPFSNSPPSSELGVVCLIAVAEIRIDDRKPQGGDSMSAQGNALGFGFNNSISTKGAALIPHVALVDFSQFRQSPFVLKFFHNGHSELRLGPTIESTVSTIRCLIH